MKKSVAGLLACIMLLMLMAGSVYLAPAAEAYYPLDYNEHDVAKLRAFFEVRDNMNITNGFTIIGEAYNADSPSTWSCCTWTSDGYLQTIVFDSVGAVGVLDLEGCVKLTAIETFWCQLTGVITLGCPLLTEITVDGNRISSIDTSQNPLLSVLWVGNNMLTELDVSSNPALGRLSCTTNQLTEIDVSGCSQLTYLHCGSNSLAELDISSCTLLTELNCQYNMLTELELSHCASLVQLRTLGNPLTTLDLSVMNDDSKFVVNTIGNGYIGVRCDIGSYGVRISAVPSANEGEEFLGWYTGDEFLTATATLVLEFGNGAAEYTAHFTGASVTPMLGDIDGDNDVDSIDALLVVRHQLSLIEEPALLHSAGDVNRDGLIDMVDALVILRHTLGLISEF